MAEAAVETGVTRHETSIKTVGVINAILGITIAAVAFLADEASMFWSTLITGLLVLVLAGYNAWVAAQARTGAVVAPAVMNIILGLWLVVSVFVLPIESMTLFWSNIVLGLLVAVFATYNTWAGYRDREPMTA